MSHAVKSHALKNHALGEPRQLALLLVKYWRRWVVPTAIATVAAIVYALVAPKSWQASQALMVRNEANGGGELGPGKFRGADDLKEVEDTILELAHSRAVLAGALAEAGAAGTNHSTTVPSDKEVDRLQSAVKLVPPKGLEFGTTEVFYLEVRDSSKTHAVQLAKAVAHHLQVRLNELRSSKAQSMIDELTRAVQVAKADLQASTAKLTELEKAVGRDLPELRSLLDSNSSDTSLRRTVSEIENELRQVRASLKTNTELLSVLQEAAAEPKKLLGAPSRLLDSQPSLRRLKDGLVDAQLTTARLQGKDSAEHPEVLSAREAEREIADRIHDEVAVAVRSLTAEVRLDNDRLALLEAQRDQSAARMNNVAGVRAAYANLLTSTTNRSKMLEKAEQNLSEARTTAASALSANLLSTVDGPDTGASPVSPGGTTIVLGGLVAGLCIGIGIVFLTAPATSSADVVGSGAELVTNPWHDGAADEESFGSAGKRTAWSMTSLDCDQRLNLKQALRLLEEKRC